MERVKNNELCTLYKGSDIVTYIRINRLRWAGYAIRLEKQNPARRVLVAVLEGRRQKGRSTLRWKDGVMEEARKLDERNWKKLKAVIKQRNSYFVFTETWRPGIATKVFLHRKTGDGN
jgi:hypothetical protein